VAGFREAAERLGTEAVRRVRHRIEHVEMVDAAMIATLADLAVVASVQPAFDRLWGGESGMYTERLGAERARTMNPFAAMAAGGVTLAFGSDSPVTPLDPWGGVRAAVRHRTPGQAMSVAAAFAAHTVGGWRAARVDDGGVLRPGAPATYAVWSGTTGPGLPVLEPGEALPVCRRTVVRGTTVYDAAG
jgi:predicted amidohydrolase YtcJ